MLVGLEAEIGPGVVDGAFAVLAAVDVVDYFKFGLEGAVQGETHACVKGCVVNLLELERRLIG